MWIRRTTLWARAERRCPYKSKGRFVEPTLLRRTVGLPEGAEGLYELKLDGYRAIGFKARGEVELS